MHSDNINIFIILETTSLIAFQNSKTKQFSYNFYLKEEKARTRIAGFYMVLKNSSDILWGSIGENRVGREVRLCKVLYLEEKHTEN